MKIELSAKDIRLLKILLTLLIAVLMIRLLILPAAGRNQTLGYELDEAQQKQEEMQYRINGMDTSRAMVKKAQDSLAELSKPYYGLLEQQEIDEIVTGLAYKHGLFPSRLEIGERMDSRLAPYIYSAEGDGGRKEKSASGTEETGG